MSNRKMDLIKDYSGAAFKRKIKTYFRDYIPRNYCAK